MKKITIFLFLTILTISCSSGDKQAQIAKLEAQRDALTEEIEQLKQSIFQENGEIENEKIKYVEIIQIEPRIFKHYIKVQGTIESNNNIFTPPQASGIVKKIYVQKGEKVLKGQLLAELDGSIYESTIMELETNMELATTIFERQERLWNKKIGSEIQYLQAKTNKESLGKRLITVNEQYKLTKIFAPISGTVDEVNIKVGEAAAAGIGAIRIVQLSDLKITAVLSENYISQVKKKDSVHVHIPVLDKSLNMTIKAVSQVIDPENRTFNIELKIPENKFSIKPNMLAVLTINDYTNPAAITVPVNIIQRTSNKQFIFVTNEDSEFSGEKFEVEMRYVKTGKYYDNLVEITEGLTAGEIVVFFGFQDLADGQIVMVSNNQAVK